MYEFGIGNYGLTTIVAPKIVNRNDVNFTSEISQAIDNYELKDKKKSNHTLLKAFVVGAAAAGMYLVAKGKAKRIVNKLKEYLFPEIPPKFGSTSPKPVPEGVEFVSGAKPVVTVKPSTGSAAAQTVSKPQGAVKTQEPKTYPQAVDKYETEMAARRKAQDIEAAWAEHEGTTQTANEINQYLHSGQKVKNPNVPVVTKTKVKQPAIEPKLEISSQASAKIQPKTKSVPVNPNQNAINAIESQLKEIDQAINTFSHPKMSKYNKILKSYQQEREALLAELQELESAAIRNAA